MAEFALVFPIIMLVVFGFIDIGRAVFEYTTLANAARQGARVAVVSQLDPASDWKCQADKPVENKAAPNWTFRGCAIAAGAAIGVTNADVDVDYDVPDPLSTLDCVPPVVEVGCIVTITVDSTFEPLTPLAGIVIGTLSMSATSVMPVERTFPETP